MVDILKVQESFELARKNSFATIKHEKTKMVEKGHGRQETRAYWIIDDTSIINTLNENVDWEKVRSIGMVESERVIGEEMTKQTKYYILSIEGNVEILPHAVRTHWGIENKVRWILDVAFREDISRLRAGNSAHNFALLRHIALNLLRKEKTTKVGTHAKRLKAGWSTNYLEKFLIGGIATYLS